jgi:hypothetical protein
MSEMLEASLPVAPPGKKRLTKHLIGKQALRDANLILNAADRVIAKCIRERRPWGVEELEHINMALLASLRHMASDKGNAGKDTRLSQKVSLILRIVDQAFKLHQGKEEEKVREEKRQQIARLRELNDKLEAANAR